MERKSPSGPQPIAKAIREFLSTSAFHRSAGDERVLAAWTSAAGPRWAEHASPVAFRGGQLTVEVTSAVHLSELKSFHAEDIRRRANAALGETRIQKILFKPKS